MQTPNTNLQTPNAEDFARQTVSRLLQIARASDPQAFRGFFMGAIVANVIGNLPEDYWQKFRQCEPCGVATCNCHLISAAVQPALDLIRDDHQQNTPRSLSA